MRLNSSRVKDDGFTLIEVAAAMAVLTVVITALVSSATAAIVSTNRSRGRSMASLLAVQRMEELRSLSWGFGEGTAPVPAADVSTNLSLSPSTSAGPGLSPSSFTLATNTDGYVDYFDQRGEWVGNGTDTPDAAAFVRRWRVSPLPGAAEALVLEVVVAMVNNNRGAAVAVRPDDVRLLTVKARKAR